MVSRNSSVISDRFADVDVVLSPLVRGRGWPLKWSSLS